MGFPVMQSTESVHFLQCSLSHIEGEPCMGIEDATQLAKLITSCILVSAAG